MGYIKKGGSNCYSKQSQRKKSYFETYPGNQSLNLSQNGTSENRVKKKATSGLKKYFMKPKQSPQPHIKSNGKDSIQVIRGRMPVISYTEKKQGTIFRLCTYHNRGITYITS